MSSTDSIFLRETAAVFKQYKFLADQALVQVTGDEQFFREFGPRSNSIAAIVKHVAGNLKSRWQDFLTTDGEKPDRNRDDEFVISGADSRAALMDRWEKGWAIVTKELEQLKEETRYQFFTHG